MTTLTQILEITPNGANVELTPWFKEELSIQIDEGIYPIPEHFEALKNGIVSDLVKYSADNDIDTVVVGMSGGVDSALTATLFKAAGWRVIGVTLPIFQKEEETERGLEAIEALGIEGYSYDLSDEFTTMMNKLPQLEDGYRNLQRQGNIKAKLRMMTLYHLAHMNYGLVASTDNFSELSAGFWTLHGDVGDVSPIQTLTKSWEVPSLARYVGVPESTVIALPTDGLGISKNDMEQLGVNYLEFDIALFYLMSDRSKIAPTDEKSQKLVDIVRSRIKSTSFKRNNPYNTPHPFFDTRLIKLDILDAAL